MDAINKLWRDFIFPSQNTSKTYINLVGNNAVNRLEGFEFSSPPVLLIDLTWTLLLFILGFQEKFVDVNNKPIAARNTDTLYRSVMMAFSKALAVESDEFFLKYILHSVNRIKIADIRAAHSALPQLNVPMTHTPLDLATVGVAADGSLILHHEEIKYLENLEYTGVPAADAVIKQINRVHAALQIHVASMRATIEMAVNYVLSLLKGYDDLPTGSCLDLQLKGIENQLRIQTEFAISNILNFPNPPNALDPITKPNWQRNYRINLPKLSFLYKEIFYGVYTETIDVRRNYEIDEYLFCKAIETKNKTYYNVLRSLLLMPSIMLTDQFLSTKNYEALSIHLNTHLTGRSRAAAVGYAVLTTMSDFKNQDQLPTILRRIKPNYNSDPQFIAEFDNTLISLLTAFTYVRIAVKAEVAL